MYVDTKFNSLLTALTNVFLNLTAAAMKMTSHIRSMHSRPSEKLIQCLSAAWQKLTLDIIGQVFNLQFTLTRSHLKAWPGSSCSITEDQIRWSSELQAQFDFRLGAKAFWNVLSPRQTGYRTTLVWLEGIIEGTKCGKLQRTMERIVSRHSKKLKV